MSVTLEYLSYITGSIAALLVIGAAIWRWKKRKKVLLATHEAAIVLKDTPSWQETCDGVLRLSNIIKSYQPELLLALSSGGTIVAAMLSKLLNIPIVAICKSNPRAQESNPSESETLYFPRMAIRGKRVLLVDDVVRSGNTLYECYQIIETFKGKPTSIKSACLLLCGEHWKKEPDYYVYRGSVIDIKAPWDCCIIEPQKMASRIVPDESI